MNPYVSPWQFLWQMIKPYRWWYLLILQAPFFTAIYVFVNNYALKVLIDVFSDNTKIDWGHLSTPIILWIGGQILLDIIWRLSNFGEWKAEPYVRKRLLLSTYDYVQYHAYSFFQNTPSGTVISKLKGILEGYDAIFSSLHHTLGRHFSIVVLSIFVLWIVNTAVFLFMLVWVSVFILIMYPLGLKLNEYSNATAESKHQVIGTLSDNLTNIFSLFYFATRKIEYKRVEAAIEKEYVPSQIKMYKYDFKFNIIGSILYWIMLIAVFFFMIWLRKNGDITTGDFIFVMLTTLSISFELWSFIGGLLDLMKAMGDYKASFSILSIPNTQAENADAKTLNITQGAIEFKNLRFAYENANPVFNGLSLAIKGGEKIGIIGHSGAGKSTLVSLLLKNFEPQEGFICIDGQNLTGLTVDSIRKQIALIPQDIMLFHRSIGENIGYAKENATFAEIKRAAQMANIDAFIESLPQKYETMVGERGIKLSGGQRQRIAIARAFLKKAPIIILDEATSSLDSITEQQIQESIDSILEQKKITVIAIAHRLSTIRHMDKIVVMDKGKVIEEGTFDALIAKRGYFKTLWDNQVNGMVW